MCSLTLSHRCSPPHIFFCLCLSFSPTPVSLSQMLSLSFKLIHYWQPHPHCIVLWFLRILTFSPSFLTIYLSTPNRFSLSQAHPCCLRDAQGHRVGLRWWTWRFLGSAAWDLFSRGQYVISMCLGRSGPFYIQVYLNPFRMGCLFFFCPLPPSLFSVV